tara:strand:- start:3880 stop:5214 length:1335 start_codon:yes stop_codon:yes gene_type:complete
VPKFISIKKKINNFKKNKISVPGDKSLSIRFVLLSSLSSGKSTAYNLLKSDDVLSAIRNVKKLGIKVFLSKLKCEVYGKGLFNYKYRKNLVLDAGNSGTTARLLCSALIDAQYPIKIVGDRSLMKRDMSRIIKPLKLFGVKFKDNNGKLPIFIKGTKFTKPINYTENLGSAQCKSAVMIAALKTLGTTKIKSLPSRNHTELMFKNVLNVPIKLRYKKKYDLIEVKGKNEIQAFNYKIPGDISSAAFFIVLTLLSKNSKLLLKNVNINPSRIGIIKILKRMGAKIKFLNKKNYKGEMIGDIFVKSTKNLKAINLDSSQNSSVIDEFLLVFLVASKCKGVSSFEKLSELNKKESKRLDWGIKILKMMNVKVLKTKNNGIKIWGNNNSLPKKNYIIKNFLKDHRIFMLSAIAALSFGGNWKIYDPDSINTSFPGFIKTLNSLGAKIK